MRTVDLIRAASIAAVTATLATGCAFFGDGSETGVVPPMPDSEPIVIFNPCTDLPDETLAEVGLDPATKGVVTDPEGESTWRVCQWRTADNLQHVTIMSTTHTLDEARTNDNQIYLGETTVNGRTAQRSYDKAETDGRSCYTSIEAEQGMFEISASWTREAEWTRDSCEVSDQFSAALEPHLPK